MILCAECCKELSIGYFFADVEKHDGSPVRVVPFISPRLSKGNLPSTFMPIFLFSFFKKKILSLLNNLQLILK